MRLGTGCLIATVKSGLVFADLKPLTWWDKSAKAVAGITRLEEEKK